MSHVITPLGARGHYLDDRLTRKCAILGTVHNRSSGTPVYPRNGTRTSIGE